MLYVIYVCLYITYMYICLYIIYIYIIYIIYIFEEENSG